MAGVWPCTLCDWFGITGNHTETTTIVTWIIYCPSEKYQTSMEEAQI